MTSAQRAGLIAVRDRNVWKWTASGKWAHTGGTHANSLNALARHGLIGLSPGPDPWINAVLTRAGEAALERRRA